MRASDADREQVVTRLRDHFGAGRLSEDEFSSRVDAAYASATMEELQTLTLDLPERSPLPDRAPERHKTVTRGGRALRAGFRIHFWTYVLVNVMLVGIWAASGGGYFWPIWSILGWGIGVGAHAAPILAGVGVHHKPLGTPTSPEQLAKTVDEEQPDLLAAAAPDGTVTLLFSDIADSTEINDRLGDLRWLELLRAHHDIVRDAVAQHRGYEVKAQGDGFMLAFPSARSAVLCAQRIMARVTEQLGDHPDGAIRLRMGLHTGEAIKEGDDFYGRNVVRAARIAAAAEPGEVLVSAVVKHLTDSAGDIAFGPERVVELKGLGSEVVHRVE